MFDKIKNRLTDLESETAELKSELAKVRGELADVKKLFSKLTGEINALRRQTDSILRLGGIVPV
jgi:archaellum component FlaC